MRRRIIGTGSSTIPAQKRRRTANTSTAKRRNRERRNPAVGRGLHIRGQGAGLICPAFLKCTLSLLRFHQILRSNRSSHASLRCSPTSSNPALLIHDFNRLIFLVSGRPFANTIGVILVIIRMRVLAEKRKELSQTIASLSTIVHGRIRYGIKFWIGNR